LHLGEVHVAEGGVFRQFVFAEGGRLARIETRVHALQGASVELGGVYVCGRARHADITSQVVHAGARGATRQLVKGAVRSGGRGVFQGKILVERAAQKTDARQHHHALLLEEGAEVDAKPELEIYADDVACAHGAATGALDAEALFYLRQRGLPLGEARALLTAAFLREAIPTWLPQADRDTVEARLDAWLEEQA
jgi:Fe-S cluster assembly protein SufD